MSRPLPRGIRNHNPGNIRLTRPATPWQGAVPPGQQADPAFVQFSAARWGIRALARTLITYQDSYGLRSIRQIITRWAPPAGTDQAGRSYTQATGAYIAHVAALTGFDPDDPLDVHSYAHARPLVEAIIRHENGDPGLHGRSAWYSRAEIDAGLRLAGIEPPPAQRLAVDPEFVGTATATAGITGEVLLQQGQQLQVLSASGALGSALQTIVLLLIVGGVALNLWARMRRSRREGA